MHARLILFLVVISLSGLEISAQVPDWYRKMNKLTVFPASEYDVNRLFEGAKVLAKTPEDEVRASGYGTRLIDYDIPVGKLSILFSAGKCSQRNTKGWDLEDGTIINFRFTLNHPIDSNLLKLNSDKLQAARENDIDIWFFTDEKKGLTYIIANSRLTGVEFSLPEKYFRFCDAKKQPSAARSAPKPRPIQRRTGSSSGDMPKPATRSTRKAVVC